MTPRRLDWALRARGTQVAEWPEGDRAAALALLRRDPAARAALADALARDDAGPCLARAGCGPDGCILARMQSALHGALLQLPPLPFAVRWGMLTACAVAGLYLGIAGAAEADAGADAADALTAVQAVTVASSL